ncbi:MAG: peptidylprolyl isomerase [Planctomycetota bacterium]|jgi:parvulin-like peptidyl-prolyl isomerase
MTLYVNNEPVDQFQIEQEIHRLRPSHEQAFQDYPEQKRQEQLDQWAIENVIEAVLFRQWSRKEVPIITDSTIQAAIDQLLEQEETDGPLHQQLQAGPEQESKLRDQVADQIRHERLMQKITADLPKPGDRVVRRYYQEHIDRYMIPEMVHAAHIVKHPDPNISSEKAEKQIQSIYQELTNGASFEELAPKHSDCPDQGGDLGFFARGKMVPCFEEVAFGIETGTYSEPFETEFGWHIAKVYEKRAAVPCPLDQVRDVIVRDLQQQAREKAVENYLDGLKEKAVIEER